MAKKALIVIDYTNDFVHADGALTCGVPGQEIEHVILSLIRQFHDNGDEVIHTVDIHFEGDTDHPESKLFPPHNIENTWGRQLYGLVGSMYDSLGDDLVQYVVDKTRYSSFHKTELLDLLIDLGVSEIHLVGVCTDICVLHTAVDAYNLGFNVVVHQDAVASFNPVGHEWALNHFEHTLGFKVV